MSKLRSDELVNMEGDGAPSFPQSATTIEPTADNQVATKSYVDLALSAASGNAVSATPPTNPALGSFWTDTSVSPSILKTWNGNTWIEFAGEGTPYTGFLGSPVEVLTPLDGAGVGGPTNYTAKTSQIATETVNLDHGHTTYNNMGFPSSSTSPRNFAKGNGVLVVCSTSYGIKYSYDNGYTWSSAATQTQYVTSVLWTGQKFIATSREVPFIFYSSDGVNWSASSFNVSVSVSNCNIQQCAYSPTLDRVVACNNTSNQYGMFYSDDHGVNWSAASNPSDIAQQDRKFPLVEWGNGRFVATPEGYDEFSIYSTNGTSWTRGGRVDNNVLRSLTFNPDNNTFYALGANNRIFQSSGGTSWSSSVIGGGGEYTSETNGNSMLAYDNGVYYIVVQQGTGRMIYSTNLSSWYRKQIGGPSNRAQAITMIDGDLYIMSETGMWLWKNNRSAGFGSPVLNTMYTALRQELTFENSNVYNNADDSVVPNADFATVFNRALINPRTGEGFSPSVISDGYIKISTTSPLSMYSSADQGSGDTIRTNSELTLYGPSPTDVVFTSQNANTTPVSATDATVAFRKWTLETRASSSDPWTVVTESDDYDIVASQDGSTPWSASPTLQPNTSYRVKVSYHSANAETVESVYNTFETGPS